MFFDEVEDIIVGIKFFWIYATLLAYLTIPMIFIIYFLRHNTPLKPIQDKIAFKHPLSLINQALKWVVVLLCVAMLTLPSQVLIDSIVRSIEQTPNYLWDVLISNALILFSGISVYALHLLLPISTVLMLLSLFAYRRDRISRLALVYVSIWLSVRMAYVVGHNIAPYPINLNDHDPRLVFGGLIGSLIMLTLALAAIAIGGWLSRRSMRWHSYLITSVIGAPVLVLIWGTFDIGFVIAAADYSVTVFAVAWMLSAHCREKMFRHVVLTPKDNIVDSKVPSTERRMPHRSLLLSPSWIRVVLLVLIALIPATVLKWFIREVWELPLNGSVTTWIAVWLIALVLGALSYVSALSYDSKDHALTTGVSAFLGAFVILILNLGEEHLQPFPGHFNAWGVLLSIPLAFSSLIGLVVTVAIDRWRWSLPFWTGCLFVYIFVHSFAGHRYVIDLSELHLFSWINMSLIVFVFLFSIPAYFASNRVQLGRRATTE